MRDDFAVFILTHGRANEQKTLKSLQKCGYTGRLYLIVDDGDSQLEDYKRMYGDSVIVFNKESVEHDFDTMTSKKEYRSVVYARNYCKEAARKLGVSYVFQFDEDISQISFRIIRDNKLKGFSVANIDKLFSSMVEYMENAKLSVLGFSQAGAYIGGAQSPKYIAGCQRNCAQAMMFNMNKQLPFRGIFNEDLQIALDTGWSGGVVLSTMLVSVQSPVRTTNKGGLHELYMANSTYTPCFYTVMAYPSVASIVGDKEGFKLNLKASAFAPMVISEKWRRRNA